MTKLLTTTQAAKVLGLGALRTRICAEEGRIRAIHTPLGWLLDADDVALFAAERARRRPGAQPRLSLPVGDDTANTTGAPIGAGD